MKRHNKYLTIIFLSVFTLFQGCETLDLDKLDNPNALGADQADPTLLFNTIQLNYRNAVTTFNNLGGELSRIENMFGRNYRSNYPGNTLNGPWSNLYSGMIPDIAVIEEKNSEGDYNFVLGASKAMEAHVLMLSVDYMGDIVWSQAFDSANNPNPTVDQGSAVYEAALGLLDEATTLMTGAPVKTALDMYYGGSSTKWLKFINTLKMRAALTVGDYQAVINATNVIEEIGDNFVFEYGTNQLNPDTRHPDYANDYTASGANNYRSNWLMHLMKGTWGDNTGDDDPRRRFYFYRQSEYTPGSDTPLLVGTNWTTYVFPASLTGTNEDAQTLVCSVQETPTHLQFTPDEDYWCGDDLGYWGRTHGNAEGIPPDGFQRTASGVYPAGGRFDAAPDYVVYLGAGAWESWNANVGIALGAQGAGIEPIILSSFVEFWRAEAYLKTNQPALASQHFAKGIEESVFYVATFGARDTTADLSLAPDVTRMQEFVDNMQAEFDSAANSTGLDGAGWPVAKDKMDLLGEQFFVAMYGGGADAFNFIRRTGYPRTLARSIDPNPGDFPRSFLYPSDETGTNPNINQKSDLSTKVFWDQGVTNPAN